MRFGVIGTIKIFKLIGPIEIFRFIGAVEIYSYYWCDLDLFVCTLRGWTLLMGNTRPECFLRGLKFLDKQIRGLKFLGENLRGLKPISNFDQILYKISIFWKIQTQTFEGLIYCSKTPAATSLHDNDVQI